MISLRTGRASEAPAKAHEQHPGIDLHVELGHHRAPPAVSSASVSMSMRHSEALKNHVLVDVHVDAGLERQTEGVIQLERGAVQRARGLLAEERGVVQAGTGVETRRRISGAKL
jgi:hypothetical protein